MEIKLFTTGCPLCRVIERKLIEKEIAYTEITDIEEMKRLGIQHVPVLLVGDELMKFSEAIDWVRKQ